MNKNLIAQASILTNAPVERVWQALTDPEAIRQYMFGALVTTDWQVGSAITWKGEWQGSTYEDRGTILQFVPIQLIQYSHFSPLSGLADEPENYHTVTVEIFSDGKNTRIRLTQDHNTSEEERRHSQENWEKMLQSLKDYLER